MQRPIWLAILDRCSVGLSAFAWAAVIVRIAPAYFEVTAGLALILGLVAGYVIADFFSGLVHWLADRYFDPKTPVLGPALIAPFREHHADALAMTRHDFFEISGNNSLGVRSDSACRSLRRTIFIAGHTSPIHHPWLEGSRIGD
jgi:hypothetical protein